MRISLRLLVGLAVLFLIACSKSKDEIPVAKVEDRVITLAEFERAYGNVNPKYLPNVEGFDRLLEFLETLIDKEVMAVMADRLGYDKHEKVLQGMDAYRKMGLQAAYLKFRVADKIELTEELLRDYYSKMNKTITMKQILVDTKEEAEEVYRLLKDGSDFESVCKRYSKSLDAQEGGKSMTATFGHFQPQFKELFELPVGGITRPIESVYGYFVIKIMKITQAKNKPFEEMREKVEQLARSLEEYRAMDELTQKMRERAGVEWYDDNIRIVFEALPPDRPLTNPPSRKDEVYPLLKFDEVDLDKPIVSYKDSVITIRRLSDIYDKISFFERPRRENRFGGIKGLLIKLMMVELMQDEFKRSRIGEQPELRRVIKRKEEELMVTQMFDEMVIRQTTVSGKEIQDYYNEHKELYTLPEQRRYGIIVTGDRSSAQEAYEKLQAGMAVDQVARLYSIDEETRANRGETELLPKGSMPEIDDFGYKLEKVGDISKPFESSKGWVVLKLIEKAPERSRTVEEVRGAIEADIKNLKNDARLLELMEKWKKEIKIERYTENLKKAEVHERKNEAFF